MKDYSSAYKAYDIRSIYEEPIDATFAYNLGRGVGKQLVDEHGDDAKLVFGADVRDANNELIYWFLKGVEVGGCSNYVGIGVPVDAVDDDQAQLRGVGSTAMLYYVTKDSFDMGVMFTASHNPAEYVGMKIVNNQSLLIDSTILQSWVDQYVPVEEAIDETDFQRIWNQAMGEENELYELVETKIQSLSELLGEHFSAGEQSYTFVVDYSNGAAVGYERIFLQEIVSLAGHTIIELNEQADSNFSAHLSDTTDPADYKQLQNAVTTNNADFGIMFDGDADRIGFVDATGKIVGGDMIAGSIALEMLQEGSARKKVIHDVFFTKAVLEAIRAAGGEPIKSRVGHRFVKELFKTEDALFAGELSAHLFFRTVGGFESPLLALAYIMGAIDTAGSLEKLIAPFQVYHKPALRKYTVASNTEKEQTLQAIQDAYSDYTLDFTDGVGVYADDFRFVIRPSNTEPVLKMVMEADNQDIYDEQVTTLEALIATNV